jgi:hypothetical protein
MYALITFLVSAERMCENEKSRNLEFRVKRLKLLTPLLCSCRFC